jgi:hypothetical protein
VDSQIASVKHDNATPLELFNLALLSRFSKLSASWHAMGNATETTQDHSIAAKAEAVFDEMFTISVSVFDRSGDNPTSLILKARVLVDFVDHSGDLVHQLAEVLSKDILKYFASEQQNSN